MTAGLDSSSSRKGNWINRFYPWVQVKVHIEFGRFLILQIPMKGASFIRIHWSIFYERQGNGSIPIIHIKWMQQFNGFFVKYFKQQHQRLRAAAVHRRLLEASLCLCCSLFSVSSSVTTSCSDTKMQWNLLVQTSIGNIMSLLLSEILYKRRNIYRLVQTSWFVQQMASCTHPVHTLLSCIQSLNLLMF